MTRFRHSALSHVGRVRRINEDSILSLPDQQVWVVSDGMGGHEAGDFASQTVVEQVAMMPEGLSPSEAMQALRSAILRAHVAIAAEADRRGAAIVGATVVALLIGGGHYVAFWAGDSRLYRFRDGGIDLLTTDHSTVAELVLDGSLTWDEAEHHPQSNAITRAVGVDEVLDLDKVHGEIRPGDRFLLCSDGLTKYAGFETLRRIVTGAALESVSERLMQLALDSGGADNISIIVVDVL